MPALGFNSQAVNIAMAGAFLSTATCFLMNGRRMTASQFATMAHPGDMLGSCFLNDNIYSAALHPEIDFVNYIFCGRPRKTFSAVLFLTST